MSKTSRRIPPHKKGKWDRTIPDTILLLRGRAYNKIPSAESLHPDQRIMSRYIDGDPTAMAIIDAWAFRAPVVEVCTCE